jgi:hypothetical protein
MPQSPSPGKNRRGSPDAIKKRRAARQFNEVLILGASGRLDGRTEKRRQRLLAELREGKRGARALKPIDVLLNVQALLELGEIASALRKIVKPPRPLPQTDELVASTRALHRAYKFQPEVYAFVGIDGETLSRAGVLSERQRAKAPLRSVRKTRAGASRSASSGRAA